METNEFSTIERKRLLSCHADLANIFYEVRKHYPCRVICGHRNEEEQNRAYEDGFSKVVFPDSKHNSLPSRAIDVAPLPIDWNSKEDFYYFAGHVRMIAESQGVKIRWGGDWNRNLNLKDQTFFDLVHFELVDEES